jgi:Holliday junction resolvase RusA-like endonuclease
MLAFSCPGVPAPQGSKKAVRHRHTGRIMLLESSKRLHPWRESVAAAARAFRPAQEALLEGPLIVDVVFSMPRPKSHYRASGELKPSAPRWPSSKPDVDKLVRAVLDSLTGVVWRDDSQVVELRAVKQYGEPGVSVSVDTVPGVS